MRTVKENQYSILCISNQWANILSEFESLSCALVKILKIAIKNYIVESNLPSQEVDAVGNLISYDVSRSNFFL